MSTNSVKPTDAFKGVWIPKHLFLDPQLTPVEMILLANIDSLDHGSGCWASNFFLATRLKVSAHTCSAIICSLRKRGYIVDLTDPERKQRHLTVTTPAEISAPPVLNSKHHIDISDRKNKDKTKDKASTVFDETKNSVDFHKTCKRVVKYLNHKTNSKYRDTTPSTLRLVTARLKEAESDPKVNEFRLVSAH